MLCLLDPVDLWRRSDLSTPYIPYIPCIQTDRASPSDLYIPLDPYIRCIR